MSRFNKIQKIDCMKGLDKLEENSVDVIVTSPPYNIGVEYNEHEDNLSHKEYLQWMEEFGEKCKIVLKQNGSLFFNIGDKPSDDFRSFEVAERISKSLEIQNKIHWVKHIAVPEENVNIGHYKPVNSDRYINNCHEYIFHFTINGDVSLDPLAIGVPYADKSNVERWDSAGKDLRDRGNMWYIPYDTVTGKKAHPAAFPVKLPEMCIKLHGIDGEGLVLDPFIGSGSTAIASKELGHDYLGFEIDQDYINKAEERLKQRQKKIGEFN